MADKIATVMRPRYTLDDLMRVTGTVEVTAHGHTRLYYLRTIGQDADDARRAFAVSKSRQTYRILQDHESSDYLEYILDLETAEREHLERVCLVLKRREFQRQVSFEVMTENTPEPPSNPTPTDVVEAEEAEDIIQEDTDKRRVEWVDRMAKEYEEELHVKDIEALRELTIAMQTSAVTDNAFSRGFNAATLYWATFKDAKNKQRAFMSPSEVYDADPALYNALLTAYYEMDVFSADSDALKN
jgi:hypothetical protein